MKKMENPFNGANYSDQTDVELIEKALDGHRLSVTVLIQRHQQFIYNVALKMINNIADAEDVTQEILIKLVTNLAKYDSTKGKFRTWLYRVTFNHVLNLKKQKYEVSVPNFEVFFDYIEGTPNQELEAEEEIELSEAIEEGKTACMAGMIMCLDREQRLIYIVGEVFEIDHNLASKIFEITPSNFRKKLSRARQHLYQWMNNRCGLVNSENPCRCPKKTKGFIEKGWVDPENYKWNSNYKQKIGDISTSKVDKVLLARDQVYAKLYRDHPFKTHEKSEEILSQIFNNKTIKDTFNL